MKLRMEARNIDQQFCYIFSDDMYSPIYSHCVNAKGKYEKYNRKTSDDVGHRSFASSETDTSDDVEILTCFSKDIPVKKIHESKDLGPVYSKSTKKRNKYKV